MAKVTVPIGLPASGKTTWRKFYNISHPNSTYTSKDEIREFYPGANESFVHLTHRDDLIAKLKAGWDVVIDNTNLNPKTVAEYEAIAKDFGAEFEIKDFTDVSMAECMQRDLLRKANHERYVGRGVIFTMAVDAGLHKPGYNKQAVFLVDVDGTVADVREAKDKGFLDQTPKDWDGFHNYPHPPNQPIVGILQSLTTTNTLLFCSGRSSRYRAVTEAWLSRYGFGDSMLIMRGHNDKRPDDEVKRDLYHKYIEPYFDVLAVFDDRNSVVKMWRGLGLTCLQVAEGDF